MQPKRKKEKVLLWRKQRRKHNKLEETEKYHTNEKKIVKK
jgi:hypothetical protein